jgi:hypothetical protein
MFSDLEGVMDERGRERRRIPSGLKQRPPSSPVNVLILVVVGVLGATALTAAFLGNGLEETTPHGQVLTALQRVAEAQEEHYHEAGAFARWMHSLDVEPGSGVQVEIIRGDGAGWAAVATHPMGLSCEQAGKVERGRALREQPTCYTTGGH